ncbi:unnamed protein product, partial [Effrenium voratum]
EELDELSRHAILAALDSRAKDHLNRLASAEAKDALLADVHRKWQSIQNAYVMARVREKGGGRDRTSEREKKRCRRSG